MIEPLSTAAIAIGTILATKALERTGENIGGIFWNKSQQFITTLKKDAPETAKAIELAPKQPLDYGQAVLEVETATKNSPELAQLVTLFCHLRIENQLTRQKMERRQPRETQS